MVEYLSSLKPGHSLVSNRLNHETKPHRTGKAIFAGIAVLNCSNRTNKSEDGLRQVAHRQTDYSAKLGLGVERRPTTLNI
jgi:hypothetical protein